MFNNLSASLHTCPEKYLSVYIIVFVEFVHGFEELMVEDKRSYNYQRTEKSPTPEISSPEGVRYSAIVKFVAHARTNVAPPNKGVDAQCEPRKDEENQTEVHGMPVVVPAGDGVYFG